MHTTKGFGWIDVAGTPIDRFLLRYGHRMQLARAMRRCRVIELQGAPRSEGPAATVIELVTRIVTPSS